MYANILVPVAFDHGRSSQKSLEIARSLADEGAAITVLHVMEEVPSYVAQYLPEGQMENNAKEVKTSLKAELGGVTGIKIKVVSGHAGHTIVEYAASHGVDCIVVASHRPGLQDFFLGSTAARVVRRAPCAVHVSR